VPETARFVLDVGCGCGAFGRSLKERGVERVDGIDIYGPACEEARNVLDDVICGDIEVLDLPYGLGQYDCIVFADVLEHLREPGAVLCRMRDYIAPNGVVIASIPNVRFCYVVRSLVHGRWKYEDAGILDRTHLRFFTATDMALLFCEAGYRVTQLAPLSVMAPELVPRNTDGGFTLGNLTVGPLTDAEYQDFLTYQYLVVAEPGL